jgi:hypothetical protein
MRKHRHPRFRLDARDEAFSPARHDHVDAAVQSGEQQAHRGAIARRYQRDGSFGQPCLAKPLNQAVVDRAAGTETVGAAAQDHRVAGFQAQHAGIGGDIGTALENHGNHAERHANAFDGHAVRTLPTLGDGADRIGNVADGRDPVGHRIDARRGQRQPIDECGCRSIGAHLGDIFGIGRKNGRRVGPDGALDRVKCLVLLVG